MVVDRGFVSAHYRDHAAWRGNRGFLHVFAARGNQAKPGFKAEHARQMQCCVFSQTQPGIRSD